MRKDGEESPLDYIPELNDEIEIWFFKNFQNLKNLTGFEHHLSITDFTNYFNIYPIPFSKITVISIIKKIERLVSDYNKKVEKAKSTNAIK